MNNDKHRFGISVGLEGVALGGRTGRTIASFLCLILAAYLFDLTPDELQKWLGLYSAGWASAWSPDNERFPPAKNGVPLEEARGESVRSGSNGPSSSEAPRAKIAPVAWACAAWSRWWLWQKAADWSFASRPFRRARALGLGRAHLP